MKTKVKKENKVGDIIAHAQSLGYNGTMPSRVVYDYIHKNKLSSAQYRELFGPTYKVKRGLISMTPLKKTGGFIAPAAPTAPVQTPAFVEAAAPQPMNLVTKNIGVAGEDAIHIPKEDECYVPWGEFKMIKTAIESRQFFPIFIAGLSGNGKTVMVEQACARCGREYIRVQISKSTDEDELIGGWRLMNGETVFFKGPVIRAYERGAILLLDEVDRGSNNLLCLQGIMEGKPVLLKRTGELIYPASGFNVIATANTKGRGSEDGRYSGALVIDDAFLERFVATIDQDYPPVNTERKIVLNHMNKYDCTSESVADSLVAWAAAIRKTFNEGGVDEVISTRRLCHIVQSYSIFRDVSTAIRMCVSRFDQNTRDSFVDLYDKMVAVPAPVATADAADAASAEAIINSAVSNNAPF